MCGGEASACSGNHNPLGQVFRLDEYLHLRITVYVYIFTLACICPMSVKPDSERLQPIEQTNNRHATLHEYNQNLTHQTLLAILLSGRGLMDGIH